MNDREKIIKGLECCAMMSGDACQKCPYENECWDTNLPVGMSHLAANALALLQEQEKEIKALHLLVEWARECDFGFDQFPGEYEQYKDKIKGMKYIDGMIYIAKRTLEDHGTVK